MKASAVHGPFSESIFGVLLTLMFLLLIAVAAAYGLSSAIADGQPAWLIMGGMIGILTGWFLGMLTRKWWGYVTACILGLFFIWIYQAQVSSPIYHLLGSSGSLILGRIAAPLASSVDVEIAIFQEASHVVIALGGVAFRFFAWLDAISSQSSTNDTLAVNILWGIPVWFSFAWLGWSVRRHNKALTSLLPVLVLVSGVLGFVRGDTRHLTGILALTLMMMVLINHLNNERQWIIYNFDFSRDIRFDLAFLAVPVCIGLVALASIVPAISIKNIAQNIRDFFQTQSNQPISQSIGLLPQATDDIPSNSYQSPGLPRSHLLGSGPELSHKVVMYVSTGELPGLPVSEIQTYQIPVHYWRSFTYDVYTGLGWYTSFTHNESFGRNNNALPNPLPARSVLTQKIKPVEDLGGILYASGDVISVDAPYRISMREFEDPFGVTTRSKEYQSTSSVLIMDADLLRKAGQKYPEWIKQRYLALPDDLPSRVRVLAASLTVTASTPYDRAIAIETYLRKIPYTLDLGAPPAGKDVVDYFIFELRKGYCDYFASAMVVMARATGLPARLAVGYASGAYDANNARYVVTEADAHSWVEIYFPNYGWVEFEPTSNRSELGSVSNNNPNNAAAYPPWLYQPTLTAKTQVSAQLRQQASIILVLIIVVVLIALLLFFINQWRYARLAPIKAMQAIYQDLYRHGTSLQVPVAPGSTPLELSLLFSERLEQINKNGFWKTNQVILKREVDSLISLYNRAIFSPHPIQQADIFLARQSMHQVQRHVWIAWINSVIRPL